MVSLSVKYADAAETTGMFVDQMWSWVLAPLIVVAGVYLAG